jgi:alpha-dioxygenase
VRSFRDGKLKISADGLLPHDQDGIAVSGDVRNSWAGVSTLQALFIKEHNAVCDTLKVIVNIYLFISTYVLFMRLLWLIELKINSLIFIMFQKEYPEFGDEELYRHARLVTSAVIAKIHTIDWTVELLKTDTLLAGMRGNWYIFFSFQHKFT